MPVPKNFTPEEWEIVYNAPIFVATYSTMIGPARMFQRNKGRLLTTLVLILNRTSLYFPENACIQEIIALLWTPKHGAKYTRLHARNYKQTLDGHLLRGTESALPERNAWSTRALTILSQKSQPQELKEYKQWLLLIASQVMEEVKSYGFLGLRKAAADLELAQAIHDFAQVLQLSE